MSDQILDVPTVAAEALISTADTELGADNPDLADRPVDVLMRLSASARFFRSGDGRLFARVPVGSRHETLPLKSAAFRDWLVRLLIDPQSAPLVGEPGSTRDLMVNAINGWLLAFDNVSVIPTWLADSLCRVSSGGGFAARALFSDTERSVIHAQRPIVLNGIDEFVRRSDLADRVVFLYLPPISSSTRREEDELWKSFHELYPRILGGLLDAVVGGLRELPSVNLAELPRMADFARFGEAVTRGLGRPAGTFIAAYSENRKDASGAAIEDSPLGNHLLETFARNGGSVALMQSPSEMLRILSEKAGRRTAALPRWPKSPSTLGNELRRLAPQLRTHGIHVTFTKTRKTRLIAIESSRRSGYSPATP